MNKVLIALSSADHIALQSGKTKETGFFLLELMKPVRKLLDAGFEIEFANPLGNKPPLDPMSDSALWYGIHYQQHEADKKLLYEIGTSTNFTTPKRFDSITDSDLAQYIAMFIPGGHAPMVDLTKDAQLGRILCHFFDNNKYIAAICHGPAALLSAQCVRQPWIFNNYHMTCFSNSEEKMIELLWWDNIPKVQEMLENAGAVMDEGYPMQSKVTTCNKLITAQGVTSADEFSDVLVRALNEARGRVAQA